MKPPNILRLAIGIFWMDKAGRTYHENLLHWIWKKLQFNHQQLRTPEGKEVFVFHPGTYNKSDGPDFTNAEIAIDKLRWYGDVEIHWRLSDWKKHHHQNDRNFNRVILHVVYEETDETICRADGTSIPTLCLSPFLSRPLQAFIRQYRSRPQLPCAGNLNYISQDAFIQQLQKAHKEYFEQKVNDLMEFYDPSLPPSTAWKKMFTISLFDGLGISHNRLQMQQLAAALFTKIDREQTLSSFRQRALTLSGIDGPRNSSFSWNRKGCRPANHPKPRIKQGADMLWHMHSLPFENWLHKNPEALWGEMTNSIASKPGLGQQRSAILFGTVFLPALYSLGNLFYSNHLKNKSWALWRSHRVSLPESLLHILQETGISEDIYAQKLGTIYQLRSYCHPRQCQKCKVFKRAISS